jgi:hypothetical protein
LAAGFFAAGFFAAGFAAAFFGAALGFAVAILNLQLRSYREGTTWRPTSDANRAPGLCTRSIHRTCFRHAP